MQETLEFKVNPWTKCWELLVNSESTGFSIGEDSDFYDHLLRANGGDMTTRDVFADVISLVNLALEDHHVTMLQEYDKPEVPLYHFTDKEKNLDILCEEAAEIIQVAMKINRFGYDDCNPKNPEGKTNRLHLEEEVGDLLAMIDILRYTGILTEEGLEKARQNKFHKLKRWYAYEGSNI